tara:strand:- start:34 stop:198 length:165 start_codon:yes stop_codon:yes gene_type:complete
LKKSLGRGCEKSLGRGLGRGLARGWKSPLDHRVQAKSSVARAPVYPIPYTPVSS